MPDWSSNSESIPPRAAKSLPPLLWVGIACCLLAPVVALLGSVLGMLHSFEQIEALPAPTPDDLAVGVHRSMGWMICGAVLGVVGACVATLAILRMRRDEHLDA